MVFLGLAITLAGTAPGEESSRLNDAVIAAFLSEHVPEAIPLLAQAKDLDPEGYEQELTQVSNRIREYRRILKASPDVAEALVRSYQLEFKANVLTKSLADLPEGDARDQRLAEIRPLLEEIFDLRLRPPEMEIESMERRIGEIKDALERKRNAKERIVAKRMEALTKGDTSTSQWW
jgi:hypothetical protein